ncbi:hypothetical protein [Athalassotoga saccharophila]|uniref:hypothetical protein n=1 Tax=Athalassotoga saccharophila TaxID=1441386 RepID=UPI00137977D9|nr:hypothetical protein [Athalassotoga saccharophila]BBJ28210.1 hypothetical protein ATHSA_1112 [Athalassotoga saccharophila]
MKRFLLVFSILVLILVLSSCMLIKGSSKPMILDLSKSATLLSGYNIEFSAKILSEGQLPQVVFDLDNSPLPTNLVGTSTYVADWVGVYGKHKITVFAVNPGGMVATKTDTFFVKDSTPPIVKALYPSTIAQGVVFPVKIDVYDPESGIQSVSMNIDGKNVPFNSNIFDLSFQETGIKEITITAVNGQGLIATPTFNIDVVKPSNAMPYVQILNYPQLFMAGSDSTVTFYAYSPNGIKSVNFDFAGVDENIGSNASNTYTFNFKVPDVKSGLYTATCTFVDGIGKSEIITKSFLVASKGSTGVVYIPPVSLSSTTTIVPFFASAYPRINDISAYIDGVPTQIYGKSPDFYIVVPFSGEHKIKIVMNNLTEMASLK